MLEVTEADLELEVGLPCERGAGMRKSLARARRRERSAYRALRWRSGSRRAPPRCTELTADGDGGFAARSSLAWHS